MSSIHARNVSMAFETRRGSLQALDDVSLEIPDAHFTCLVGASGCGKSTLLNIMAGLIEPTAGEVLVDGRAIDGPGADRGMVFQSYTLYPWMTVRRNVEFGPKLKGMGACGAPGSSRAHIDRGDGRRRVRRLLSQGALGRHEAARGDRPRARE